MKNMLGRYIAGALTAALFALPAAAQGGHRENHKICFGYNAIENAITSNSDVRSRLFADVSLTFYGLNTRYSGLNEMNSLCTDTYYGRNVFTFGTENAATSLAAVLKTGENGISDVKFGLRNTGIAEKLGGYGFIDLTADLDALNISAFYGKSFGKGISFGIYHEVEYLFGDAPAYYEELQINKCIGKRFSLFARTEVHDFDISDATALAGVAIKL